MPPKDVLVRAALSPYGFPTPPGPGLGFTSDDDARLARGWPEIRLLTEEVVTDKAAVRLAIRALDSIDPVLPRLLPRQVAARYLRGYCHGPNLFVDKNHPSENDAKKARRDAFVAAAPEVHLGMLRETLQAPHARGMGDTYGQWRFAEILFLYEAFFGTEPVAALLVEHLLAEAQHVGEWDALLMDPFRTNAAPHHLALVLPWLLHRLPAPTAAKLRQTLRAARSPADVGDDEPRAFFALLAAIADPEAPLDPTLEPLAFSLALCRGDGKALAPAVTDGHNLLWYPGRIAWLLGTEFFAGKLKIAGHRLARIVEQIAPIRDPGIVRLVAFIATQRAGRDAAAKWFHAHAAYAAPILQSLAKLEDPKEQNAAKTALDLLEQRTLVETKPLTDAEVEREIATAFAELGAKLRATKKRTEQAKAIQTAYERYVEIRSAAEYPIPEAYFTHRFGDFGLGAWAMLAVDVID